MQVEPKHRAISWLLNYIKDSGQRIKIKAQLPNKMNTYLDPGFAFARSQYEQEEHVPGTEGVRRTQTNAVSYQSKPGLGTEGDNSSKRDLRDQLTDRFLNRVTGTINKGFNPDGPQDQMEGFPTQDPMT